MLCVKKSLGIVTALVIGAGSSSVTLTGSGGGESKPPVWFPDPPIKCDPVGPVNWGPLIKREGQEAKRWKKASKRLGSSIPAAIVKDMIPLESTAEEVKGL